MNHHSTLLVIYATTHGHTAKIAQRIAEAARGEGVEVELHNAAEGSVAADAYDGVIVGGSLHLAHHQRELVDWVKANRSALTEGRAAFFSVSLTAADVTEEAREATRKCIDDFIDETGWKPTSTIAFAGALQYREYDVFTRTLMRLKMKAGGHTTDTSRDHEFTDWDSVERFGRDCATSVHAAMGER